MNHEETDRSHTMTWVLCLLALPVVYLLSVPPVYIAASRLTNMYYPPAWALAYAEPYSWLMGETALKHPLRRYVTFWAQAFTLPVSPHPP